jgi:signal transduction histidine kinase
MLGGGLESAIRTALPRIVHTNPVELQIHASINPSATIPPQIQVNVLRLAQEAVTNAVKHSGARTIDVHLTYHDGTLDLRVADDGHGEETRGNSPMADAGHFGIIGMRERCEKLGGHFEFHTRPTGGACAHATIPI